MKRPIDWAIPCITAATLGALAVASQAAPAADANNGLRLAERWCAACHLVSKAQSKGADSAPSFVSVAQRPGFSAERLAFFLLDPHPIMPNMALSRKEAADIAAYIARLRK
jgi:mono/diheme cytochrome c family protein